MEKEKNLSPPKKKYINSICNILNDLNVFFEEKCWNTGYYRWREPVS